MSRDELREAIVMPAPRASEKALAELGHRRDRDL